MQIHVLPQALFPPGWMTLNASMNGSSTLKDAVWVHANWVEGHDNKTALLQQAGVWRMGNAPRNCRK